MMDLANRAFTAQYDGTEIKGTVRRASGAERAAFLAEEQAIEGKPANQAAERRTLRNMELCGALVDLPGTTIGGVSLPSDDRAEWIDMLPDEVVTAAIFARLGLNRDLGNSPPTPAES